MKINLKTQELFKDAQDRFTAFSKSCSMKKIVSITYCKIDPTPSTRWGMSPPTYPSYFVLAIRIASISAAIFTKHW
jgi:hypothetical protein